MVEFKDSAVTDLGRSMLASIAGEQGSITYTKAIMSNQDLSNATKADLYSLTSLTGDLMETSVSVIDLQKNTVTVSASFDNGKITSDLNFTAIGWYAHTSVNSEDKLVAVTPCQGSQPFVAGTNGESTSSLEVHLIMGISEGTQVTLTTSPAGTVSKSSLDAALNNLKNEVVSNPSQPLPSGTNVENLKTTGLNIISSNDLTNLPTGFSGKGYLMTYGSKDGTGSAVHIVYDTDKNTAATQTYDPATGSWSDWTDNSNDTYSKSKIDELIGSAGIKGVSIDGGSAIKPGADGVVNIPLDDIKSQVTKNQKNIDDNAHRITQLEETQPQVKYFTDETEAKTWEAAAPNGQFRLAVITSSDSTNNK